MLRCFGVRALVHRHDDALEILDALKQIRDCFENLGGDFQDRDGPSRQDVDRLRGRCRLHLAGTGGHHIVRRGQADAPLRARDLGTDINVRIARRPLGRLRRLQTQVPARGRPRRSNPLLDCDAAIHRRDVHIRAGRRQVNRERVRSAEDSQRGRNQATSRNKLRVAVSPHRIQALTRHA